MIIIGKEKKIRSSRNGSFIVCRGRPCVDELVVSVSEDGKRRGNAFSACFDANLDRHNKVFQRRKVFRVSRWVVGKCVTELTERVRDVVKDVDDLNSR